MCVCMYVYICLCVHVCCFCGLRLTLYIQSEGLVFMNEIIYIPFCPSICMSVQGVLGLDAKQNRLIPQSASLFFRFAVSVSTFPWYTGCSNILFRKVALLHCVLSANISSVQTALFTCATGCLPIDLLYICPGMCGKTFSLPVSQNMCQ